MDKDNRAQLPANRKPEDILHEVIKIILSPFPYASPLFEHLLKSPMDNRRGVWEEIMTEKVNSLETTHNLDIEALKSNQLFITVVLHATAIAIKNHQQEKIKALANAVVNSAILERNDTDEFLDLIFIRYIDEITPLHIRLLAFFVSLREEFSTNKSYPALFKLVEKEFHNSITRDEFILVINDLAGKGLLRISQDIEDFDDLYQASSLLLERTDDSLPRMVVTNIGTKFTDFISKSD